MENAYNFFQAKKREVSRVIEDILTQRSDFSEKIDQTCRLAASASWLLNKLEDQHKSRTGQPIDLGKDPLLLILELSAYYYDQAKSGRSSVTARDGFQAELVGAQIGVALISAYTRWFEALSQTTKSSSTLAIRDPKELTEIREHFKLNSAADLATQFEDERKFVGPA